MIIQFLLLLLIAGVCGAIGQAINGYSHGGCLVSIADSSRAQLSGSVSVVSDYRYRGISLSDNEPAAQLGVSRQGLAKIIKRLGIA